jgi:hypothetical protein
MGTYPDLPSYVLATGENLQDVINKHPKELFGEKVLREFGHKDLPFLPKVVVGFKTGLHMLNLILGSVHRQSSSTSIASGAYLHLHFQMHIF